MSSLYRHLKYSLQPLRRSFTTHKSLTDVHPSVQNALNKQQPIVALESTIITHGMPYPQNLETALEVEEIVRSQGVTPATIAILNGRIKVGLSSQDLKELAWTDPKNVIKCSRRDLPVVVGNSLSGGTTVAGTMIIANMVGIRIFATGGIGGVHREGENTMDISADLVELGRTPVCVVSSGVKSILDIPRTLEFLETQGVCVSTFRSPGGCFPDFYTTDSGCKVPYNVDTPDEAAKLVQSLVDLKLESGMLIAVPVPIEHAMDKQEINEAIKKALLEAKENGIEGKAVTPFLLAAISKLTQGKSLASNMALIRNNAKVAAQIAKAYCKTSSPRRCESGQNPPVVIGGSILDLSMTLQDDFKLDGATYDVRVKQTAGGVGRNLAEGIYKLYGSANFISAIGNDELGASLLNLIPEPLTADIAKVPNKSTSLCSVIFDKCGDCKIVLGNMEIHRSISPELILKNEDILFQTPLIVMDANLPLETMETLLTIANKHKKPVFFETTDMRIASKPFSLPKDIWHGIKFISPNLYELVEISKILTGKEMKIPHDNHKELLPFAKTVLESVHEHFHCILLTLGAHGVIVDRRKNKKLLDTLEDNSSSSVERSIRFYPTEKITKLVNVSGAGDSFSSGFIANMLRGKSEEECIALGFLAARKALQTEGAVPKEYFDKEPILDVAKWKEL
ncbi:uncharacterized protein LOC129911856 [Episyrphus balteatus]|uniref:uncharacterized protein LOC129911856 n=1 Tax=Episyrphus balteatus TaxID=286459 RepID=UPI002485FF2C|nr:uncharacterized protein LOC129911856 [Episyrphus balteatus]